MEVYMYSFNYESKFKVSENKGKLACPYKGVSYLLGILFSRDFHPFQRLNMILDMSIVIT